jgi:hypothetical protein
MFRVVTAPEDVAMTTSSTPQHAVGRASASATSWRQHRARRQGAWRVVRLCERTLRASAKAALLVTGTTCGAIAGAVAGYASARGVVRGALTGAVAGATVLLETLGVELPENAPESAAESGSYSYAVFTDRDGERRVLHLSFSHTMNVSQVLRMIAAREMTFEALTGSGEDVPTSGAPRASEDVIACLPRTTVTQTCDGSCAVCLESYVEGDVVKTVPRCKHAFHANCLDAWLSRRGQCPLCRVAVA